MWIFLLAIINQNYISRSVEKGQSSILCSNNNNTILKLNIKRSLKSHNQFHDINKFVNCRGTE